jgi:hypothetical protein
MATLIVFISIAYIYTMGVLLYIAIEKNRSLLLNFLGGLIVSPLIQLLILAMLPEVKKPIKS